MRALFAILILFGSAASLSSRAGELTPGAHKRLPCAGTPAWTYDLYLPKAYGTETERRFPVLWLSSPGANPGFMQLEEWADRNDTILCAINDTKNGMSFPDIFKVQDDVMKTVEDSVRIHSCLRFSIGMSGGAWCSMHIANRYPEKHAGVVMMGHSGNGTICKKHISVAFIHGDKDNVHPLSAVEGAYAGFKSRGNPVRDLVVPGRGHESGTKDEIIGMLNWMLGAQKLTNPYLPPKEKTDALAAMKQRMSACAAISDPQARNDEAIALLDLPDVERLPEYRTLLAASFNARMDLALAKSGSIDQLDALLELKASVAPPRIMASAEQARLTKELASLQKMPELKSEFEAFALYDRVAKFELTANKVKAKLMQAQQGYESCAAKYGETRFGKRAAEAAKRLADAK
jgi:predicted esterase